ncbi:MAG: hypothetical protein V3V01_12855, partial [Acidimicrobiales bacterium]
MAATLLLKETSRLAVAGLSKVRRRLRRPDLPIVALFVGYPLWWILGLGQVAFIFASMPMAVQLARRRVIRVPKGFGLWLAFLGWMMLSATMLELRLERFISFGYRAALYFSATIFFLWVYNMPQRLLPFSRVLRLLLVFWFCALAGGYLGLMLGDVLVKSPVERLLPGALKSSQFVVE